MSGAQDRYLSGALGRCYAGKLAASLMLSCHILLQLLLCHLQQQCDGDQEKKTAREGSLCLPAREIHFISRRSTTVILEPMSDTSINASCVWLKS